MAITIEQIESLKESLKDFPEIDDGKREITKQEAIKRLASDVAELQKKGYTLDMISKIFTDKGIEIKAGTLKSYLTRAKGPKVAKGKTANSVKKSAIKIPAVDKKEASLETLKAQEKTPAGKDSKNPKLTAVDGKIEPVNSGTFKPREDSREI
ncbi:hypothetical protein [Pseudomonas sp. AB12(2023)]|uniref:hypothetical protein n=1 Tax=Pseudomonas sp. AB12(2023) TaxID=3048597 RepID=UPI002B23B5B4|nr:hypothetical protein [Pseudomonas sp. AB12(2023)]MEB0222067.1 hypothetical protein [Pseudomonas sp. AB12(2023)]